jgi:transcriptional activator HAC1
LISPNPPAIAPKSKKTERKSRKRTNSSTSDAPPPRKTKVETTEEAKRYQRLMRNRASAQQSRERKKLHLANLEREVQMLRNANSQLTRRVAELEHENNKLRGVDSFHCISGDDFSLSPSSLPHSESSSDHSEASSHPSSPLTGTPGIDFPG